MTTNYVNFLLLYSIAAKDIKHMSFVDTDQLLDQVESILLQRNRTADDDQIFKVAYKMTGGQVFGGTQDTMNTTCVKVSIRKTLANQIVRPIWEGNLIPISHANYDTLPILHDMLCQTIVHPTNTKMHRVLHFQLFLEIP